ncbi:MAG: argininosuccinate lyase, partial [Caldimonas sp.]
HAVKRAIHDGVGLADLPLATLQGFHPGIGSDVHGVLTLRGSLASRTVEGGTAPVQVRGEIARHRARLGK